MAERVLGEAVATLRQQLSVRHVPAALHGLEDQRNEVKELFEGSAPPLPPYARPAVSLRVPRYDPRQTKLSPYARPATPLNALQQLPALHVHLTPPCA
eukprot:2968873-Rhodomonas_salina.1